MTHLVKIKPHALVLFILLSSRLILSASASTVSNNGENVNLLNCFNDGISASTASDENNHSVAITVGDYCDFLNAVADDDPDGLYDERMGVDFEWGCILRSGTPGNYHYEVIGQADASMHFISWNDEERYCLWKDDSQKMEDGKIAQVDRACPKRGYFREFLKKIFFYPPVVISEGSFLS